MIELAKHIEVLLLENDCVIVPGLGGFIAHNRPACIASTDGKFIPPMRTIGFNPQLIMNDGLLVQSYMQAYSTDFPDATRKIERVVENLKDELYREGQVQLNRIGTIYYNMSGIYEFEPGNQDCFTPCLYGLENFTFPLLTEQVTHKAVEPERREAMFIPRRKKHLIHQRWIRNAVTAAATILLFFILSIPVENTYIDEANYASLGNAGMFEAIRHQSVTTWSVNQEKTQKTPQRVRNNINTLKPTTVRTEKVLLEKQPEAVAKKEVKTTHVSPEPKVPTTQTAPQNRQKGAYIIVASLASQADADRELKLFVKQGYKNTQILESEGRYRIALQHYSSVNEAYRKVSELRKDDRFKNAWVFTTK